MKFPTKINGLGGPITVVLLPNLEPTKEGELVAGRWIDDKRIIQVLSEQPVREQWRTLYHELLHAATHDSGMTHLLTEEAEEALADLVGMARILEDGI